MKKKALLTTPDYPPQLGGITTYTLDIEETFRSMGLTYDLLHWEKSSKISSLARQYNFKDYDLIFNVHYLFGFLAQTPPQKTLNVFLGSEILFTSPNFLKRVVKKFLKRRQIAYMESCKWNLFISDATMKKLATSGYQVNRARDLLVYPALNLKGSNFHSSPPLDTISFICVARDVPHKNIAGCVELCERYQDLTGRKVELNLLGKPKYKSEKIAIRNHENISDEFRDELYKKCHYNLLLSLDHSKRGFFEGFGLSISEAAKFGTPSLSSHYGGVCESVHHNLNGFVIEDLERPDETLKMIDSLFDSDEYQKLRERSFRHIHSSHSIEALSKSLGALIK